MRHRLAFAFSWVFPLTALACGGGSQSPAGAGGNSTSSGAGASTNAGGGGASGGAGGSGEALPCDVDAILGGHCRQCHSSKPVFGAPMPLVTFADLHAPLKSNPQKKVYEQIPVRIHDAKAPMPQPPNAKLSDADAAVLDTWAMAGAPAGPSDCGTGGAGGGTSTGSGTGGAGGLSCTPDVKLQAATPWVMPKDTTDEYVCYGVDLDLGEKRHMIALAPLIDNATIVHHMLLFSAAASYPSTPQPCSGSNMGQLVGVWAPGGQALELPPEAGYPLEGKTHFVLQVHYSNINHLDGEKDLSGYQLCTTNQLRPNDADILAFGTWKFTVPAQGSADITCDLDLPALTPTLHTIAGMPHMHKLGTALSTQLYPGGAGAPVDLGTADPWNFQSQVWTMLSKDITLKAGDKVSTRCAWDNPTNKDVHFGETTSDEMCFGFLMYYPRLNIPNWQWGAPALGSTCHPTK